MQGATLLVCHFSINPYVSIHAPYAGSDAAGYTPGVYANLFQSTPPMQGATQAIASGKKVIFVSIHAPYAGSDAGNCIR